MDLTLTAEEADIRARARQLTEDVLYPLEEKVDAEDRLRPEDRETIKRGVLDLRLNAINHAREVGGQGMTQLQQCIVNEEVGRATGSLGLQVWQPPLCLRAGTPEQIERYLIPACAGEVSTAYSISEPQTGSDASNVQTTATRRGNGWVLNGRKCFASNTDTADLVLFHVNVDGDPAKATLFLAEPRGKEGLTVTARPKFTHASPGEHPEIELQDFFLPADSILGEIGEGFDLTKQWFVEARLNIGARSVGMADRAAKLANDFAATRIQFGRPIRDFQAIEHKLADMAVQIMAAKSLLYRVAAELDAGLPVKLGHARVSAVKLFCSEMAFRVCDEAAQIFGGRGFMRSNPVERLWRHVRLERIWEGTSEIQRNIIAGQIKKRGMDVYCGW
jgi:alkylation response protein AidB-like acyl-CoA dehydrogenase